MMTRRSHLDPPHAWRAWFGLLGAPLAWTAQELLGYAFVPLACRGLRWPLFALDAAALLAVLAALLVALGGWRAARGNEDARAQAIGFLGLGGAAVAAVFTVMVLLTAAPHFLLQACRLR